MLAAYLRRQASEALESTIWEPSFSYTPNHQAALAKGYTLVLFHNGHPHYACAAIFQYILNFDMLTSWATVQKW